MTAAFSAAYAGCIRLGAAARLPTSRQRRPLRAISPTKMELSLHNSADFTGTWKKVKWANMDEFLVKHGVPEENAAEMADREYRQTWEFVEEEEEGSIWKVITHKEDGPPRELIYPLGEWEEELTGSSVLFGEGGTVHRNTHWEDHPVYGYLHITESQTSKGWEETKRFVQDGQLFCQRMFFPLGANGQAGEPVSAVQVFDLEK